MMTKLLIPLLVLAGLAAPDARAAQSYDNCVGFITSVPAVITTQGTWCLDRDLATGSASGSAITIQANNVTIDCNHFKLGGLGAGPGTAAFGIYTQDSLNTTIRNCNIRGFLYGVQILGSGGTVLEDNRFEGVFGIGIALNAEGYSIRRNRVIDTGGATSTNGALGMWLLGNGDVIDNTVDTVWGRPGGNASVEGIYSRNNNSGVIADNRVRNLLPAGSGIATAIYTSDSSLVTIQRNVVHGGMNGLAVGIRCSGTGGVALDNVIRGFGTPRLTCTDGGGNYTAPALP
jgi:parallel beta-helix repeat protein